MEWTWICRSYRHSSSCYTMQVIQFNSIFQAQTQGNYRQYFKLWIDYDGDGDLTDPGEMVSSNNKSMDWS